jgi:hypothetical protein
VRFDIQAAAANYRTSAPITVNVTGWPRPYNVVSITPGTAGGTAFDILLSEACSSHYAVGRPIIVTGALPVKHNVTSYASTGSDFTVVTGTAHGRSIGDSIVIEGATERLQRHLDGGHRPQQHHRDRDQRHQPRGWHRRHPAASYARNVV